MTAASGPVVAIDGGNSKTDLAIFSSDGVYLSSVRGPGMPPRLSERTVELIGELLASATPTAAMAPPRASQLVACVANVDLPDEERELERMLTTRGWASATLVANDTYAVLRAGLRDGPARGAVRRWGVGVTCGSGINCVGVAPDGRTAGFLALGQISGDWGGGGGIGAEALWYANRAADLRGPDTVLRRLVPAHFGLAEPADVAIAIHRGEIRHGELGSLTPLVFDAARGGDDVARQLVLRLAREIFGLAWSAIQRLGLAGMAVPVALGGGVIAAGDRLLIDTVTTLIMEKVPGAMVTVVREPPVMGAALLGLDRIGAPVSAMARLRASFAGAAGPRGGITTIVGDA